MIDYKWIIGIVVVITLIFVAMNYSKIDWYFKWGYTGEVCEIGKLYESKENCLCPDLQYLENLIRQQGGTVGESDILVPSAMWQEHVNGMWECFWLDYEKCSCPSNYHFTNDQSEITEFGFTGGYGCVLNDNFKCPTKCWIDNVLHKEIIDEKQCTLAGGQYVYMPCMPKPFLTCEEVELYSII